MNLAVPYISGDLTVRSLQTCFSQEKTGGAIAEGLRESFGMDSAGGYYGLHSWFGHWFV